MELLKALGEISPFRKSNKEHGASQGTWGNRSFLEKTTTKIMELLKELGEISPFGKKQQRAWSFLRHLGK